MKSLSSMIAELIALLKNRWRDSVPDDLTPRVRSLLGALRGYPVGEDDYRRRLEEKHR